MDIKDYRTALGADDATLAAYAREHLPALLRQTGRHLYEPPFRARLSDRTESYEHTWAGGQKATLKRNFADVFQVDAAGAETLVGQYELGNFKGARTDGTFCPILRGGRWYAVVSPDCGAKVYSLPELELVAETTGDRGGMRVTDVYCPRMSTHLHVYGQDKDKALYSTEVDDEIEAEGLTDWESAPFAFVEAYDPLGGSDGAVRILDLRHIERGELAWIGSWRETPSWLPLRLNVRMEHWSYDWPSVGVAVDESVSTVDGRGPSGDCGWESPQLDFFEWMGIESDPRTSRAQRKVEHEAWLASEEHATVRRLLGVEAGEDREKAVHSQGAADDLARNDPDALRRLVRQEWRYGALINQSYGIHALRLLPRSDELRELLTMAVGMERNEYARAAAFKALVALYGPLDVLREAMRGERSKAIRRQMFNALRGR